MSLITKRQLSIKGSNAFRPKSDSWGLAGNTSRCKPSLKNNRSLCQTHWGPPAQDDDDDGVGDDGYAGKDGHDDAKEGVDKVERSVELGGVHQVAGGHVRLQAGDPAHVCEIVLIVLVEN